MWYKECDIFYKTAYFCYRTRQEKKMHESRVKCCCGLGITSEWGESYSLARMLNFEWYPSIWPVEMTTHTKCGRVAYYRDIKH